MTEPTNPRRPKRGTWTLQPETVALLPVSSDSINGVGETTPRRPAPFFWHPPDQHPWGDLQLLARKNSRKCPGSTEAFQAAYSYPELITVSETRNQSYTQDLAEAVTSFALAHEADEVGIAKMDPLYAFEGYTIDQPWVIVPAFAHNYEPLLQVPSVQTNGVGVCDVGDQYARGSRSGYAPANWIRSQGYQADSYPGPMAGALLLIPPAIAAGVGELGQHGSLISPRFGSGPRLAGVTHRHAADFDTSNTIRRRPALRNLPGLHAGVSTQCNRSGQANGPGRRALVSQLRQMHSLFCRSRILRHLHRRVSLDAPDGASKAAQYNGAKNW